MVQGTRDTLATGMLMYKMMGQRHMRGLELQRQLPHQASLHPKQQGRAGHPSVVGHRPATVPQHHWAMCSAPHPFITLWAGLAWPHQCIVHSRFAVANRKLLKAQSGLALWPQGERSSPCYCPSSAAADVAGSPSHRGGCRMLAWMLPPGWP